MELLLGFLGVLGFAMLAIFGFLIGAFILIMACAFPFNLLKAWATSDNSDEVLDKILNTLTCFSIVTFCVAFFWLDLSFLWSLATPFIFLAVFVVSTLIFLSLKSNKLFS